VSVSLHQVSGPECEVSVAPLSEYQASAELIAKFDQRAVQVVCTNDEFLFEFGDTATSVHFVKKGEVRLLMPVSRTRAMGFRAGAGSLVGLPAAFSNEPYSMSALALKGTELGVMSRERFCELIATSPAFSFDVLRILAAETRSARRAIIAAR